MISYPELATLRFAMLARDVKGLPGPIVTFENWQYQGREWIGEGVGAFTDFLRPISDPMRVGAVSLHLVDLPEVFQVKVLRKLRLPLVRGMPKDAVIASMGRAPARVNKFVEDRVSLDFEVGDQWRYEVSCTIHDDAALTFVTLIRRDLLAAE